MRRHRNDCSIYIVKGGYGSLWLLCIKDQLISSCRRSRNNDGGRMEEVDECRLYPGERVGRTCWWKAKEEKNQRIFGSSNGGIMSLFIEMETTGNDFRTTSLCQVCWLNAYGTPGSIREGDKIWGIGDRPQDSMRFYREIVQRDEKEVQDGVWALGKLGGEREEDKPARGGQVGVREGGKSWGCSIMDGWRRMCFKKEGGWQSGS